MKQLIFLYCFLSCLILQAQQVQFSFEPVTDSTMQVKRVEALEDGSEETTTTVEMDTLSAIKHILSTLMYLNSKSARKEIEGNSLRKEAQKLNSIISEISDTTYQKYTKEILVNFRGNYILKENGNKIEALINDNARLKDGTRNGRVNFLSPYKFEVNNFFDEQVTFFLENGGIYIGFDSNNNRYVLKKK